MNELCVTASEFRIHLKDLANNVAAGLERVVMARHGYRMVALVSEEDLKFLRHHKPSGSASASSNTASPSGSPPLSPASTDASSATGPLDSTDLALQMRRHPDTIETVELERLYAATKDATHIDAVFWWRLKAHTSLTLRGRCPDDPPIPAASPPQSEAVTERA